MGLNLALLLAYLHGMDAELVRCLIDTPYPAYRLKSHLGFKRWQVRIALLRSARALPVFWDSVRLEHLS